LDLSRTELRIGTAPASNVQLDDPATRPLHIVLKAERDGWYVNSTPGYPYAAVNGRHALRARLHHNDEVRVGDVVLTFLDHKASVGPAPGPIPASAGWVQRVSGTAERLNSMFLQRFSIVGKSVQMEKVYRAVTRLAGTDAGVLICGETGTGKDIIARAIHCLSGRSGGRFEALNCAAVPLTLVESELFGHVRGAFTGATDDRAGRFELADGGSLFLDEIADMPLPCQAKLLRAVEEGCIRRVGDTRDRAANVRLLAATGRDLRRAVAEGRVREDLFYRLDRLRIALPPLRDREGDIRLLAEYFLHTLTGASGHRVDGLDPEVMEVFERYAWPGNVRELRNVMESMVVLGRGGILTLHDVPAGIRNASPHVPASIEPLAEIERRYILHALSVADGNKSRAARMLGINRSTLYSRLERYGFEGAGPGDAGSSR
jgi:transcriptional regulator with PAS, ATPase and Fis domain